MPRIERNGVVIAYEDHGQGPAVLLLHSFLCSGAMWAPQLAALTARWRVLNMDLRGHGASGPAPGPVTFEDLVADALAVLDHAGVATAAWAGLSIGGMVALRAVLTAPGRVRALLLLDTDAGAEAAWPRLKYRALAGIARRAGLAAVRTPVARQMFGATTRRTRPDLVAEWSDRFETVDLPTALALVDPLTHRESLHPRLAGLAVPALVLVGAEDRSLPPARSRRLAGVLADATYVEVPGAGHLSSLEAPAAVTRAMTEFLDRLPADG